MSYWSRRTIAHMLVSFGFDDGEHVAFSVEIRRERHAELLGDRRLLQGIRAQHHRGRRTRRGAPAHQRPRRGRVPIPDTHAGDGDALAVPGLCRGGQHSRRGAALLSHDHRQLHDAGLSIHEAHRAATCPSTTACCCRATCRSTSTASAVSTRAMRSRSCARSAGSASAASRPDQSDAFSAKIREGVPEL